MEVNVIVLCMALQLKDLDFTNAATIIFNFKSKVKSEQNFNTT